MSDTRIVSGRASYIVQFVRYKKKYHSRISKYSISLKSLSPHIFDLVLVSGHIRLIEN